MSGVLLTKITVWIALSGYATALIIFLKSKGPLNWDSIARIFWTIGCIAMVIHVASAFHFYHHWSHAAAYTETARQTSKTFGVNWGGGVFINYILILTWIVDVIWWWCGLASYRRRSKIFSVALHVFLFFIFFNAAAVFEGGLLRWLWLAFTLVVIFLLFKRSNAKSLRFDAS